jgi:branched-subunit amino acid aminotransferase/4-amino-4-deoxychorismate lyase
MSDDADIIDGLRAHRPDAATRLVRIHGSRLLRSALLLCGNEPDAQDAVKKNAHHRRQMQPPLSRCVSLVHVAARYSYQSPRHIIRYRRPTVASSAIHAYAGGYDPAGQHAAFIRLVEQAEKLQH